MQIKNFTLYPSTSKNATFSTDAVNTENDLTVALAVTTSAQASLNVSVQLEVSLDGTNWVASGSPVAVTTNTTTMFVLQDNPYTHARLTSTFTAGSATFVVQCQTKGF
jgi:hypothetical protein